jgi:hypothetical protein
LAWQAAEQSAEADRGRHPGFPTFNVLAGGPGSLAKRSTGTISYYQTPLRISK